MAFQKVPRQTQWNQEEHMTQIGGMISRPLPSNNNKNQEIWLENSTFLSENYAAMKGKFVV